MTKKLPLSVAKRLNKSYALDQSALFKIGSKKRLAKILGVSLQRLLVLAHSKKNFKIFCLSEEICPFTKKTKKARWVQEPKTELRRIHERIQKLLKHAVHPDYAHGAVMGRSYRTNADAHKSSEFVATFDMRKFYPSTSGSRVYDFWTKQMQCAADVAALLTKLTCYDWCLSTGSPLSPILSLYANKSLFDELNLLATENGMLFTCYIDDLTFSGVAAQPGLESRVTRIVERHGHTLSGEKTKIFRADQRKHVTGIVLFEDKIHVPHSRFQKARAIEHAIKLENSNVQKRILTRKLAGLLGEVAYLDERYANRAQDTYVKLKLLNEENLDDLPN